MALFVVVLVWFVVYLFIPVHLKLDESSTSSLHAFMNVLMTILVLTFAFTERYNAYKIHTGPISDFKGHFINFALALVPFASAMSDLDSVIGTNSIVLPLCLFSIGSLLTIETSMICDHQDKEDFLPYFLGHLIMSILIFATFLVLFSKHNFSKFMQIVYFFESL